MATNSPNGQEPGKLSGEIGAFGIARHFSMPCQLAHVRGTVLAARDFLASQGIENDDLLACELALVEACNNAIRYAPETGRNLPVEIHLFVEKSRLEMHVVDHTTGFDWSKKVELPGPEQENGRGLFIIHSLTDQVSYFRGTEENRLVLRKP